jgi:outer membrane lipoprotein-sorting protein
MKIAIASICCCFLFIIPNGIALAQKAPAPGKHATPKAPDTAKELLASEQPQVAIQMANDYFNASQFMTADFVQIGADGRRSEGKLYVSKPGRLRFEYAQPATMEIIADGVSVAIRDRKLQTQELYFINDTPLKFLLKAGVNLQRDVKIISVSSDDKATTINVEDTATFGGSSKIKLKFDNKNFSLKQWEVTDPQGYQTLITLHNIDINATPDGNLFKIPSNNHFPFAN